LRAGRAARQVGGLSRRDGRFLARCGDAFHGIS
jgi:hypothetical protein